MGMLASDAAEDRRVEYRVYWLGWICDGRVGRKNDAEGWIPPACVVLECLPVGEGENIMGDVGRERGVGEAGDFGLARSLLEEMLPCALCLLKVADVAEGSGSCCP